MVSLAPVFIQFPQGEALEAVSRRFFEYGGIKGCVGAIDCTHILFKCDQETKRYAANRKSSITLILQAIVDCDLRFLDVFVGRRYDMLEYRCF